MIMETLHGCRKGNVQWGLPSGFRRDHGRHSVPAGVGNSAGGVQQGILRHRRDSATCRGERGGFRDVQSAGAETVAPGPFGGPPGPPGPPMPPSGPPGRPPFGPPGMSAGSGVIISPEGYIVTNNHVVEEATDITVTTFDGKEFSANVVGTDPKTDLAVIKIDGDKLPFISWSANETIRVGDLVLAVGSPFGLKSSVTMGIISAMGRGNVGITEYEDFIQTDAPINPGNSGGRW